MRIVISLALLVSMTASVGAQSNTFGGAYLCLQEFGGGLSWNEASQKWDGTAFNPSSRFVLRLDAQQTRMTKNFIDEDVQVTDYKVTVTAMGDDYHADCSPIGGPYDAAVTVGDTGWIACNASLSEYRINLSKLRFLEAYMIGFVSGEDNNDNTPSMMAGTCAKIE